MLPTLLTIAAAPIQNAPVTLKLIPKHIRTAPTLTSKVIQLNPTTGPFDTSAPDAGERRPGLQLFHNGRYTPVVMPLGTKIGSPTFLSKNIITYQLGGPAAGPDCGTYTIINKTPTLIFNALTRIGYNVLQASTDNRLLLQTRAIPPTYHIYNKGTFTPLPSDANSPYLAPNGTLLYNSNNQVIQWENGIRSTYNIKERLITAGSNNFFLTTSSNDTPPTLNKSTSRLKPLKTANSTTILNESGAAISLHNATTLALEFNNIQRYITTWPQPIPIMPVAFSNNQILVQSDNKLYQLTLPSNLLP